MDGARLPLAFILAGLAELLAAAVWLSFQPELLLLPHMHPSVLAVVHLLLPGFLLCICLGAAYQLVPVILGEPLRGGALLWAHFFLHAAGLPLLVVGFATYRFEWVALGGTVLTLGIMVFVWQTFATFRRSSRRDGIAWSLPLAAGWLAVVVVAGILMALNRRWPTTSLSPLALLRAHAHLGLIGFFLTLLQGVSFQLVPMFTLGQVRHPGRITAGLACTQAGLLALAPALAWNLTPLGIVAVTLLIAGIAFSATELAGVFKTRRKRILDTGLTAFATGAASLLLAAITGAVLYGLEPSALLLRGASAYGVLIVPGALALMVLGMLCKIIPFLVWMRAYGSKVGREPVPATGTLSRPSWEKAWFTLHVAALTLLAGGACFSSRAAVTAGALMLLIGLGFYVCNTLIVLSHLIRDPSPVPFPGKTALS